MREERVVVILSSTLLLLFKYVLSQTTGDCNIAMCLGSSPTVNTAEYGQMLSAATSFTQLVTQRHNNVVMGAGIYSNNVLLRHRCYPETIDPREFAFCLDDIFVRTRDTSSSRLDKCLEMVCSHNKFYQTTQEERRYDLVIVSDSSSTDEALTTQWAQTCRDKGVVILCVIVGDAATTPEYEKLCGAANLIRIASYSLLNGALTTLSAKTCDVPAPPEEQLCNGGSQIGQDTFVAHPEYCDAWIRCQHFENGTTAPKTEHCPCSDFFRSGLNTCVKSDTVTCEMDPCAKDLSLKRYAHAFNCNAFWKCAGGKTKKTECCFENQRFDSVTATCVADPSLECQDECHCERPIIQTDKCKEYDILANHQDSQTFLQFDGRKYIVRACALGTSFNETSCECDIHEPYLNLPNDQSCAADFLVLYDHRKLEDKVHESTIIKKKLAVDKTLQVGIFTGISYFKVPRYNNVQWMTDFGFITVFDGRGNLNDDAPLVSNGACVGKPMTVEIRLARDPEGNPIVECDMVADMDDIISTYSVSVPYKLNEFNTVLVAHSRTQLSVRVVYEDGQGEEDSIYAPGNVMMTKCDLTFGWGGGSRYFIGYMQKNEVYTNLDDCNPDLFR